MVPFTSMKLRKDIFKSVEDYLEFLLFLNKKQEFTISEIEAKFGISYDAFYKKIIHWSEQGLVIKDTFPPTLGGPKLKFWLSEKAKAKLKHFLKLLSLGLQLKKSLLKNLQNNLAPELNEKVEALIEAFFVDFFN